MTVDLSPNQPQPHLRYSGGAAGVARRQHSISTDCGGVVRMVEHVEEVDVEPERRLFSDLDELEQRYVLKPLTYAGHVLVAPRGQVVVEGDALHRTFVQRDPDVVGVPELAD